VARTPLGIVSVLVQRIMSADEEKVEHVIAPPSGPPPEKRRRSSKSVEKKSKERKESKKKKYKTEEEEKAARLRRERRRKKKELEKLKSATEEDGLSERNHKEEKKKKDKKKKKKKERASRAKADAPEAEEEEQTREEVGSDEEERERRHQQKKEKKEFRRRKEIEEKEKAKQLKFDDYEEQTEEKENSEGLATRTRNGHLTEHMEKNITATEEKFEEQKDADGISLDEDGDEDEDENLEVKFHVYEEMDPSECYVDEFVAVQNPERQMADRIMSLRSLLYNPVPEGVTLKCQIDRHYDHSGSVYFSFILPVERDGQREKRMTLMIAKCRTTFAFKPTYVVSLEPLDFKRRCASRSERYFGKIQMVQGMDALGLSGPMQYVIYDDGYNPLKLSGAPGEVPVGLVRKEFSSIIFAESKAYPDDMQMTVALSRHGRSLNENDGEEEIPESHLCTLEQNHLFAISERIAQRSDSIEGHPLLEAADKNQLAFRTIPKGKKKHPAMSSECRFPVAPSVKNFELAAHPVTADSKPQCGLVRIGKERFFTLVTHPFSPFEAFGICISKFDASNTYRAKIGRKLPF